MGNPNNPLAIKATQIRDTKKGVAVAAEGRPTVRGLVKIFAVLSSVGTRRTAIMPSATYSRSLT
eukprot:scaffold10544_cov105-Isochrysis_galbana.AAC.6